MRAHAQKDIDDQIAWLEKGDPDSAWTQCSLNGARGEKALQAGQKTEAAKYLRLAIDGYQKLPRTAASLNNCGLVYFDLFEATGHSADHQRGLALLEEAITLDPSDSILLNNTVHCLISRAVMDVMRDAIRTEAVGEAPELSSLALLYSDEAARETVFTKLRNSDSMQKGLGYLDKALLLAPKNLSLYQLALAIHGGFRDLEELKKLRQRFQVAAPDLQEITQRSREAYRGEHDQEYQERLATRIHTFESLLNSSPVKAHPLTAHYVTVGLLGYRQAAAKYGAAVDERQLLEAARAAYASHPNAGSHYALLSAHYCCASAELARQNKAYAELASQTRRALSPQHLILLLLEGGGQMAELVRQNPNVAQAIALEKENVQRFAGWVTIEEWAALRATDPAQAAVVAQRLKANETARLRNALEYELNPLSASAVVEQYWTSKLLGEDQRAAKLYRGSLPPRSAAPGVVIGRECARARVRSP